MNTLKISFLSKVTLLIVSGLFFASLFFPMWQIELTAPQYPEGLVLKLYANKIGGNVDIINGLNHYIGMATLHTENFPEFSIMPYIFIFFGLFAFVLFFIANKKGVVALFITFVVFVILAAIDFYRWNYEYGHNLDPNAAIVVPGMAYQPPLIGYKQLLNFGAYSVPDIGGWLLIVAGVLLFSIVVKETNLLSKFKKSKIAIIILSLGLFASCGNKGPEPLKLNSDQCHFCKMTIADGRFGSEFITPKRKVFKFDDVHCMSKYVLENKSEVQSYYICNYNADNELIPAETAYFLSGGEISSPMRGNIAAFTNENEAKTVVDNLKANPILWNAIMNN